MKNKFLGVIIVLAVAAVAAWNVNFNSQKSDLSDISLANVEALADESYEIKVYCCGNYGECMKVYDPLSPLIVYSVVGYRKYVPC